MINKLSILSLFSSKYQFNYNDKMTILKCIYGISNVCFMFVFSQKCVPTIFICTNKSTSLTKFFQHQKKTIKSLLLCVNYMIKESHYNMTEIKQLNMNRKQHFTIQ